MHVWTMNMAFFMPITIQTFKENQLTFESLYNGFCEEALYNRNS